MLVPKMASNDGKFDDILLKILQNNHNHVLLFLEEVFGFLHRRTDFYDTKESPETSDSVPIGLAEKIINLAFKKYKCSSKSSENVIDTERINEISDRKLEDVNELLKENDEDPPDHSYAQWKNGEAIIINDSGGLENVDLIASKDGVENIEQFEAVSDDKTNILIESVLNIQEEEETGSSVTISNDLDINDENDSSDEILIDAVYKDKFVIKYSLEDVISYISNFELNTNTHFVQQKKDTGFNQSSCSKNSRIQWQSICAKSVSVYYDGIPFVFLGEFVLVCHRGKAKASQKNRRERISQVPSSKIRLSKKVDCPARIYVKKVLKFPEYKIKRNTEYFKDKASRLLRADLQREKLLKKQIQFYIRTPEISDHQNHIVGDLDYEQEKDKRNVGRQMKKSSRSLSPEQLLISQEVLDAQLQQDTNTKQIAVVFDNSGIAQQFQIIDPGEDSPTVYFQTLNADQMEIS